MPFCLIRADASAAIGGGHVMRCATLTGQLQARGWRVGLLTTAESARTTAALLPPWMEVLIIDDADASDPFAVMRLLPAGCDLLLVDHYGLDARFERPLAGWARRIAVLDDLADRPHHCDLLLDQTLERTAAEYVRLVPAGAAILTGTAYALLRPDYAALRMAGAAKQPRSVPRIVIAMGLSDANGHACRALEALTLSGVRAEVVVVTGSCSPTLPELRRRVAGMDNVSLQVDSIRMPEVLAGASLCLGALGGSSWERCCLGVPTLAVVLADNQRTIAANLFRTGAVAPLDSDPAQAGVQIRSVLADQVALDRMAAAAAALCDGLGAPRVALLLDPERDRNCQIIALRPLALEHEVMVFSWQTAENRRYSRNPEAPSREGHAKWIRRRLADPHCITEIVCRDGVPVGMVRLDPMGSGGDLEVSILIAPGSHGQGIGTCALNALRRLVPKVRFAASIANENAASRAAFAKAGYVPCGDWFVNSGETTAANS